MKGYDTNTAAPLYKAYPQSFTTQDWEQARKNGSLSAYEVEVISSPEGYDLEGGGAKQLLNTGPLLGNKVLDPGPTGSIATSAASTLAQTRGSLMVEGRHVQTKDNVFHEPSKERTGPVVGMTAVSGVNAGQQTNGTPEEVSGTANTETGTDEPNQLNVTGADLNNVTPPAGVAKGQTPKEKLREQYEKVVGHPAPEDFSSKKLSEEIEKIQPQQ